MILAIDQGTTGTTTVIYDHQGQTVARAYAEFKQYYPQPAWVEHDPEEIWQTVLSTIGQLDPQALKKVKAIGITNQRETSVVWDAKSGKPVYNAIVWQCRRTANRCLELASHKDRIRKKTGLPLDAYFSASKFQWICENVPGDPADWLFGTIDSWLIWKLTDGAVHATDYTNASRTMLFHIDNKNWDEELADLFRIPLKALPDVRASIADYGKVSAIKALQDIPIAGVAGDQQAALFGQTCFDKGDVKNTYGTGCFLMMNLGDKRVHSKKGLLETLAIDASGDASYALEGSVFIAGAVVQWLRDELQIIDNAAETEALAASLESNEGVYLVPAFVGLGAPHWDMDARGIICGLTRGAGRKHLARAALESMAYQSADLVHLLEEESGFAVKELWVDGGACANNFLMQFQSDILNKRVIRPVNVESTSLGAAYLAGLGTGFWENSGQLKKIKRLDVAFSADMSEEIRKACLAGWQAALAKCLSA